MYQKIPSNFCRDGIRQSYIILNILGEEKHDKTRGLNKNNETYLVTNTVLLKIESLFYSRNRRMDELSVKIDRRKGNSIHYKISC